MDATGFFDTHVLEPVSRRRYRQLLDKVYRYLLSCRLIQTNPLSLEIAKESPPDVPPPAWLEGAERDALTSRLREKDGREGVTERWPHFFLAPACGRTN
ncbi:hypothetical protein QFZ91_000199 [Paraburkholderia sp. JPY419]